MFKKPNNRKAQSAIEFLGVFSIFLIITGVFYILFISYSTQVIEKRVYLKTGNILRLASSKINTVVMEGDGYSTTLELPSKILNSDYDIEIEGNVLILESDKYNIIRIQDVLPVNITGELSKGNNIIKNVMGGIVIEEI